MHLPQEMSVCIDLSTWEDPQVQERELENFRRLIALYAGAGVGVLRVSVSKEDSWTAAQTADVLDAMVERTKLRAGRLAQTIGISPAHLSYLRAGERALTSDVAGQILAAEQKLDGFKFTATERHFLSQLAGV